MKKRIISLFLALAITVSLMPVPAFADEDDEVQPSSSAAAEVSDTEKETVECHHEWVSGAVIEPTCSERGFTSYTCSLCGETKKDDYTNPIQHTPVDVAAIAATCTVPGKAAGKVCSVCGTVLEGCMEIPALGHIPEKVDEIPPEIGKPGKTAGHMCAVCGAIIDGCEEIPIPAGISITIDEQPKDSEPVEGVIIFSVVASVNSNDVLTYQWQRLDERADYKNEEERETAWEEIIDKSGKKENQNTLKLTGLAEEDLDEAMNHAYRCVVMAGDISEKTVEVHILDPRADHCLRDAAAAERTFA